MKVLLEFLKNWTLPVAILTGVVVYMLFSSVPFLKPIGQWYAPYNDHVVPGFMFLVLYVTFCKVSLRKLLPVKWHLWICIQQVVFVLVLTGVAVGFHLSGAALVMVEAILVCVIGPCASAAPVVTAKLGGCLEEMTTYTFLSNFVSALLIPLCFPILPHAAVASVHIGFFPLFLQILWKVSAVLLLPMLLAFVTKHAMPDLCRHIVSIPDLSYYLWGGSLVVVTGLHSHEHCRGLA